MSREDQMLTTYWLNIDYILTKYWLHMTNTTKYMSKISRNVIFSKSKIPTPRITHCTISHNFLLFFTISYDFLLTLTISHYFLLFLHYSDQFSDYSVLFLVISVSFPTIPLLFSTNVIYLLNQGSLIKISLRNLVCNV